MRENLWLLLRNSKVLRKLSGIAPFTGLMRAGSFRLVPSTGRRRLRVRSGPGRGLVLELNPRWEYPFWEGTYELQTQELICRLLKPETVFFDVGANFGFYSLLAARAGATVYAFEPDTANADSLEHHARVNRLEHSIRIIRAAVFSHTGEIALVPAESVRAHGNAQVRSNDKSAGTVSVPCVTLDDFVLENPAPSLVKIDVEGAESEVLKGAGNLFDTTRPHLLCEVHDAQNAASIEQWLKARGYESNSFTKQGEFPRHVFASPGNPVRC